MLSSPTPWTTDGGTIKDFTGKVIGKFENWRDAEAVCGELTDRMDELKEEAANANRDWEEADGEIVRLDGILTKIAKVLQSDDSDAVMLDKITKIVNDWESDDRPVEYTPIDRRD